MLIKLSELVSFQSDTSGGYTGSRGFTGSQGIQGNIGFTGSQSAVDLVFFDTVAEAKANTTWVDGRTYNIAGVDYTWTNSSIATAIAFGDPRYLAPDSDATGAGTGEGRLSANSDTNIALRWSSSGSAPRIGFYNTTPVVQPTIAAAATDLATAITLVNSIRTILIQNGLAKA